MFIALLGFVHGLDITTGAKTPPSPGQNDGAHIGIMTRGGDRIMEICAQRITQSVETLGAIHGEGGDVLFDFINETFIVHIRKSSLHLS